jgi:hypothetical protein
MYNLVIPQSHKSLHLEPWIPVGRGENQKMQYGFRIIDPMVKKSHASQKSFRTHNTLQPTSRGRVVV